MSKSHPLESKHTPGPWSYGPHKTKWRVNKGGIGHPSPIAIVDREDDAALISAAPSMEKEIERLKVLNADLLAALRLVNALATHSHVEHMSLDWTTLNSVVEIVEKALVRAEKGGTP